jgi:hypothetical protein
MIEVVSAPADDQRWHSDAVEHLVVDIRDRLPGLGHVGVEPSQRKLGELVAVQRE